MIRMPRFQEYLPCPFYRELSPNYDEWTPKFMRWEELSREIQQLKRHLIEIERERDRLQPQDRYRFDRARVLADSWHLFVHFWRDLQASVDFPCSPLGKDLTEAPEAEQKAWRVLQIGGANE